MRFLLFGLPLLGALIFAAGAQAHVLVCRGYRIIDDSNLNVRGRLEIGPSGKAKNATLHFRSPTGSIAVFNDFRDVPKDGSNFSSWFESESRAANSDEGLYAGVSEPFRPDSPMYEAARAHGPFEGAPERTFIVYASTIKVYAELFCYDGEPRVRPKN